MRFAVALANFATFLSTLEPRALDLIRRAFAAVKVPTLNDGTFSLKPLSDAVPHPAVTSITTAAHEELAKRAGSGWTPQHVMDAFSQGCPTLVEPPSAPPAPKRETVPVVEPPSATPAPKRETVPVDPPPSPDDLS